MSDTLYPHHIAHGTGDEALPDPGLERWQVQVDVISMGADMFFEQTKFDKQEDRKRDGFGHYVKNAIGKIWTDEYSDMFRERCCVNYEAIKLCTTNLDRLNIILAEMGIGNIESFIMKHREEIIACATKEQKDVEEVKNGRSDTHEQALLAAS